jgi:hypothetical protein
MANSDVTIVGDEFGRIWDIWRYCSNIYDVGLRTAMITLRKFSLQIYEGPSSRPGAISIAAPQGPVRPEGTRKLTTEDKTSLGCPVIETSSF